MNPTQKQYQSDSNLNTRISIHDRYSTNKQGFGNWIVSHYEISSGAKILELGCGTGSMWKEKLHLVRDAHLVLTDFSEGMLESAMKNLNNPEHVTFQVVDIQNIPYPDHHFDVVIANMMLYHVPDLRLGLSEVRRVLKPGGTFYCATYGEHGIVEFVAQLLRGLDVTGSVGTNFTLQNGGAKLSAHFDRVHRLDYPDSLAVTCIDDFIDYLYSLSGLSGIANVERSVLTSVLAAQVKDGILHVPKEYGMFICK